MLRLALFLLLACTAAAAQSSIPEGCAQAGLKAVEAIDQEPHSEDAKTAIRAQMHSCNILNGAEMTALIAVEVFKDGRKRGELPSSCKESMEDAFRHNLNPGIVPACFSTEWQEFNVASLRNWR
jgi:hypothetical protein